MNPVGRPRNIDTPNELIALWDKFKKKIDDNPDYENVVTVKGEVVKKETKKPYTIQAFQAYVFRLKGFTVKDYLSGEYPEFSDVVSCIKQECEDDQISGTMTGKYKAQTLVARLNGYVDNKHVVTESMEVRMNLGDKKPNAD